MLGARELALFRAFGRKDFWNARIPILMTCSLLPDNPGCDRAPFFDPIILIVFVSFLALIINKKHEKI